MCTHTHTHSHTHARIQVFDEIDEDDGGFILFNEFCSYLSRMKAQSMSNPEEDAGMASATPVDEAAVPHRQVVLPAAPPPAQPRESEQDLGSKLLQLAELKQQGILTEDEFSAAKAKCIATHGI